MIRKFTIAAALTGALMAGTAPAAHAGPDEYLGEIITYGGDGRTTFALPDLRGRTAIGAGQGPGLTARRQGERGGTEYESTGPALAVDSERGVPGSAPAGSNMPPYLALRQCIVTQGIFPSRN